jgi:hypothetical protein
MADDDSPSFLLEDEGRFPLEAGMTEEEEETVLTDDDDSFLTEEEETAFVEDDEESSSEGADVPLSSPHATRAMVRKIASRRFPVIPVKRGQAPGMTTRERPKTAPNFLIQTPFLPYTQYKILKTTTKGRFSILNTNNRI